MSWLSSLRATVTRFSYNGEENNGVSNTVAYMTTCAQFGLKTFFKWWQNEFFKHPTSELKPPRDAPQQRDLPICPFVIAEPSKTGVETEFA